MLVEGVREPLRRSLAYHLPVRAALADLPSAWYGQQDARWIAYYDALRRLGLAHYAGRDEALLDEWAALARATGWWWPGESICVTVERPSTIDTDPVPNSPHEEVRVVSAIWP